LLLTRRSERHYEHREEEKNINQFAEKTPQLYLTDQSSQRNAIQFEGKQEADTPLGVLSEQKGTIILHFKNTNNLLAKSLILVDTKTGEETNLLETNTYQFQNDPNYSDRFLLRVGSQTTAIFPTQVAKESSLHIYTDQSGATVTANQRISMIEVFDIRGQLLSKQTQVNKSSQRVAIPSAGLYIVKVTLGNGERVTRKLRMD